MDNGERYGKGVFIHSVLSMRRAVRCYHHPICTDHPLGAESGYSFNTPPPPPRVGLPGSVQSNTAEHILVAHMLVPVDYRVIENEYR